MFQLVGGDAAGVFEVTELHCCVTRDPNSNPSPSPDFETVKALPEICTREDWSAYMLEHVRKPWGAEVLNGRTLTLTVTLQSNPFLTLVS